MVRRSIVVWCVGWVLGCGGAGGTPAGQVRRPGATYFAAIRIDGNRALPDDDVIPALALHRSVGAGRPVDPLQLAQDVRRVRNLYAKAGYFAASVAARIDDRNGAQTAVFTVTEGPHGTTEVVIHGLPADIPYARARALVGFPDGALFDYTPYLDARDALQALLEGAGYARATVVAHVFVLEGRVHSQSTYRIVAGPRCTFGPTTIGGATGTLAAAITARIAYREGDVYSPAALAATQRELYQLGRFSTVLVEPDRTGDASAVAVKITVARGARRERILGGGLGFDPLTFEARVRAGGSYIPRDRPLWSLAADARVAATIEHDFDPDSLQPKIRALVSAQRLDLFRPRLAGEVALGYDFLTVETYTSTGPQLRLGLTSPLGPRWLTARVGWAFSYLTFSGFDELLERDQPLRRTLGLDEPERVGTYQGALAADLRDNPADPSRGVYLALRANVGTRAAGGAHAFTQPTLDVRAYTALGSRRVVLGARVRAGAIVGTAPATERYYGGGVQSHRGFPSRKLTPTFIGEVDGKPATLVLGGTSFVEAGAELRVVIGALSGYPVGALVFVDAGNVGYRPEDLDPRRIFWATGAGAFIRPYGIKIHVDLGYLLNPFADPATNPGASRGWYDNLSPHFGVGDTF